MFHFADAKKAIQIMANQYSDMLDKKVRYSSIMSVIGRCNRLNPVCLTPAQKSRGFSLPELITAVAIVGILAAIAYPSYQQYVIRTNRSEVQQFMLDIVNREEQYLLNTRSYGDLTQLGMAAPARVAQYYTVNVAVNNGATPPTYAITAVPKGTQAVDGALNLNSLGVKTPADKWK
jgi:type IV pilus assembly protein PilE